LTVDQTHIATSPETSRKSFMIDTSVLLYDKESVHSFPGNDLVITMVVLDELDRFKDRNGIIGENARYVNRYLDMLRDKGSLHEGVELESGQIIRVEVEDRKTVPEGLDSSSGDNRIIGHAHALHTAGQTVVVVTKDINFRVKCDALGIPAEDYYKDNVPADVDLHAGLQTVYLPSRTIDKIHSKDGLCVDGLDEIDLRANELVVVKSSDASNHSTLAIHKPEGLFRLSDTRRDSNFPIQPRNKEQRFAMHLLEDPDIPLVTLTGIAGSGKTFLTLMAALNGLGRGEFSRVVISRPVVPVGRDLGFLPGDIKEKMAPWLTPIADNFRDGAGDTSLFEMMMNKGQIEVAPLSFIRGRTFNDCFMIVDEAQNATIHELKTVITRVGKNSKLVLLGDTDQVDTPYIDSRSNGLSIVVERFKDEWESGHIRLPKGERSDLATLASRIL